MIFHSLTYHDLFWLPVISILAIWTLIWKGMALWKAAKYNDPVWFVVLLIVNTLGILDILYIYFFSKSKHSKS